VIVEPKKGQRGVCGARAIHSITASRPALSRNSRRHARIA
jgi:hypothetical protein